MKPELINQISDYFTNEEIEQIKKKYRSFENILDYKDLKKQFIDSFYDESEEDSEVKNAVGDLSECDSLGLEVFHLTTEGIKQLIQIDIDMKKFTFEEYITLYITLQDFLEEHQ